MFHLKIKDNIIVNALLFLLPYLSLNHVHISFYMMRTKDVYCNRQIKVITLKKIVMTRGKISIRWGYMF